MVNSVNTIPLGILCVLLIIMVLLSAFFSGSEIGIMSVNRYKLKNKAKTNKKAKIVENLLQNPERILAVILIGNTLANICAASIATMIGVYFYGEVGALISTGLLTLIILIFSEVSPKTVASIYPERIALSASHILNFLLIIFSPIVLLVNSFSKLIIELIGINITPNANEQKLTGEELKTVINESVANINLNKKSILLKVLDLEQLNIEHIMIQKSEIIGIDLNYSWNDIIKQLANSQHSFLPVYENDIENLRGVLHLKIALNLMAADKLNSKEDLRSILKEASFCPKGTALNHQMFNFQKEKTRLSFVVDEYGDIQGLVTLEDILEEIIGEFTTDMASSIPDIHPQDNGSYIVEGGITLRQLKSILSIPPEETTAKTLSGYIVEYLEMIPEVGITIKIEQHIIEVLKVEDNVIKSVRVSKLQ